MRRRAFVGWVFPAVMLVLGTACHNKKVEEVAEPAVAALKVPAPLVPGLEGLTLGMTEAALRKARPNMVADKGAMAGFRHVFLEEKATPMVSEVTYYTDADLQGHPLYEIIAQYRGNYDARQLARQRFGPANNGDEWLFTEGASYPVKAWIHENKLIVAAVMPGTEWAE